VFHARSRKAASDTSSLSSPPKSSPFNNQSLPNEADGISIQHTGNHPEGPILEAPSYGNDPAVHGSTEIISSLNIEDLPDLDFLDAWLAQPPIDLRQLCGSTPTSSGPPVNVVDPNIDPALTSMQPVGNTLTGNPREAAQFPPEQHSPASYHSLPPSYSGANNSPPSFSVAFTDHSVSTLLGFKGLVSRYGDLLNAGTLRLCLQTYFDAFNIHMPLFHLPTFTSDHLPRKLLFIMAAIGALYRLERRLAAFLYLAAEDASKTDLDASHDKYAQQHGFRCEDLVQPSRDIVLEPNWTLADGQTQFLLAAFGTLSGNNSVSARAMGRLGILVNVGYNDPSFRCAVRLTNVKS
jgi:hypothetical protein